MAKAAGAVMLDAGGAPAWAARMQARRPVMWLGFMTVPGGWWGAAGRLSGAVPQLAGAGADTTRDHPQNSPREKSQKSGLCSPHCWPRRRAHPRGTFHAVSLVAVVRPVSRLAMTK